MRKWGERQRDELLREKSDGAGSVARVTGMATGAKVIGMLKGMAAFKCLCPSALFVDHSSSILSFWQPTSLSLSFLPLHPLRSDNGMEYDTYPDDPYDRYSSRARWRFKADFF